MQRLKQKFMHLYQTRLPEGSFGRKVLVMLSGTALGQLASVILSPLLTRLYTPAEFGVMGSFSALVGMLCVVAVLRYELALPLAKDRKEMANLLSVCGVALLFMTLLAGVAVLIPNVFPQTGELFGIITPYRALLPLGLFIVGGYQIMVYLATREDRYKEIARTKISQGLAGPISQIIFGLFHMGSWGLITGFIISQSTGVSLLYKKLVRETKLLKEGVSWDGMKAVAARFKRFPLISSWAGLISTAGGNSLVLLLIPYFYSSSIAGFLFLTDRVIGRPLLMITTSILQVYVGDVSQSLASANPEAVRRRFIGLAIQQLVIVSSWLLLVNLVASWLFPVVFGEQWAGAVPFLHVMSIAYLFQMVMHAMTHTLQILEKHSLSFYWETGRLIAVVIALVSGYALEFSALQTLLGYALTQAAAQIILFVLMFHSILSLQRTKNA